MTLSRKGLVCVIALVAMLVLTGGVFAGGKKEAAAGFAAAMATDVGGLGDQSFNDGCYAGLQQAEAEMGIQTRMVQSNQQTDYIPNLSGLADDGANIVFAVGFLMADAMIEVAGAYPDVYFAGIDIGLPDGAPPNTLGILFKEQESGYLAGVVAGLLTKEYASASPKLNDENVIGCVLGMDIPPVEKFQAGFYAGAKSVNPDVKVISIVTGVFDDQAKGKEAAITIIEQGGDIVFQIAGLTGVGVINAAKEKGVLAIGVDVDQNYLAPDTVVTSAVKGITPATYLAIQAAVDGSFEGGTNQVFGLNEDATGIAPFHSFESLVPRQVKTAVDKAMRDIKAGRIQVPASRKEAGYSG